MSKSRILATLASILLFSIAAAASAEVSWTQDDWDTVLKKAKAEDKYIFIDFFTTWCGPCKEMDKTTYMDEKVIEFLSNHIPVKFDAEKGKGEELAEKYRISYYPTQMVLGPDGEEVDRFIGLLSADDFMTTIVGYTKGVGTWREMEAKFAKNPEDTELLFELGMKHVDAVRDKKAIEYLERYLAMDPNDEKGRRADIIYGLADVAYMADNYTDSKRFYEKLLAENTEGEWHERGLKRLPYVLHKMDDTKGAIATYLKYVDLHPEDPSTLNAFAWFCAQRKIGLNEALPIALKAVEVSGRSPGILDTLAELYFARGEYEKAITIGKEARKSDPEDQYFNDQIKKFKKAKEEAESRASN